MVCGNKRLVNGFVRENTGLGCSASKVLGKLWPARGVRGHQVAREFLGGWGVCRPAGSNRGRHPPFWVFKCNARTRTHPLAHGMRLLRGDARCSA